MKKTLLACIAVILVMCAYNKANAQISAIYVYGMDSISSPCAVPAQGYVYLTGNMSGTPAANDSIDVYVNFGDGSDTTMRLPISQNSFYSIFYHNYTVTGTFTTYIIATAPNGLADTFQTPPFTLSNGCAPLSGDVIHDLDGDGVLDPGENGIPWVLVKCVNNTTSAAYYGWADGAGHYAINLPQGFSYTVAPQVSGYSLTPTLPATGSATVSVMSSTGNTQDFGFDCAPGWDASITGYATNWRPGFDRQLWILAHNSGYCSSVPAVVTLTLDPLLSYTAATTGGTVSGNTVTWNVTSLSAWMDWWNSVDIFCSTSANLGDTLCVTLNITTTPADGNPTNNTYVLCAEVNNSMDPNDKHVAPQGTGQPGNIVNGTPLTYVVNFQNTGNDVAYNITIVDKIDSDLDFSTLQVLHSSHAMEVFDDGNNTVKFRFSDINLPDMYTYEAASHGHVVYTIKPKANLPLGTQITNTADIYFDYNEPIITNTTLNTIAAPQGIQHISSGTMEASVFPNPANGNLYVEVNDKVAFNAELYDMIGRRVRVMEGNSGRAVMDVKELPAGLYLLKLTNASNKVLSTKINIQH